jgi:hypothetical protein
MRKAETRQRASLFASIQIQLRQPASSPLSHLEKTIELSSGNVVVRALRC